MDQREWAELLDRQCRVATAAQCEAAGITKGVRARRVEAGLWSRPSHGVVVLCAGEPSYEQLVRAAIVSIGGEAVACHQTSLWLAHRERRQPARVHVAVLDGRTVAPRRGVRIHHLPTLDTDRVDWYLLPPRTRLEHTVVDLGRLCRGPGDVVRRLTDMATGAVSALEIKDLRNDRAHGLPIQWRQRPRRRDGRPE